MNASLLLQSSSIQFLVLNLDGWFAVSSTKLITFWYFIIILLYYYINLKSLVIYNYYIYVYLFIDMCICLGVSFPFSFVNVSELFCGEFLETFVILSAILLPIKSAVPSAVFWITLFKVVLSASLADYLPLSRSFWLYLPSKFLLIFLPIFLPIFLGKDKNP